MIDYALLLMEMSNYELIIIQVKESFNFDDYSLDQI